MLGFTVHHRLLYPLPTGIFDFTITIYPYLVLGEGVCLWLYVLRLTVHHRLLYPLPTRQFDFTFTIGEGAFMCFFYLLAKLLYVMTCVLRSVESNGDFYYPFY